MKNLYFLSFFIWLSMNAAAGNIYVTTTDDSGAGSLRDAIAAANSAYGADNIIFNISDTASGYNAVTGVWSITLLTPLPYVYSLSTFIDGTTQTQNHGNTNMEGPEIAIRCDSMLEFAIALVGPGCIVKGMQFNGFKYAILLYNTTSTNNLVTECFFGTDHTGTQAGAPNENGISIAGGASGNHIVNNVISGSSNAGIAAMDAGGATIRGNKIGTDKTGTLAIPNQYGIGMENSANNIIGGNEPAHRNIISGNSFTGVGFNGTGSTGNTITGNFIGTDVTGTLALPNDQGIILSYAANTIIGGNDPSKRNIISGNTSAGIAMNGTGTRQNIIKGNYIGTDTSGLLPLSNYAGIVMKSKSNSNTIGGTTPAERNIISANIEMGIYIEASDSNVITGNYLGPDATGTAAFKTGDTLLQANGIEFNTVSKYNRLGGYNSGERNVISGNRVYGMVYYGNVSYNEVVGNYIGVDASGNNPLPNATGICVDGGSNHNPIINNVLSGNISYGIFIVTTGSNYNEFKGNILGLNAAGTDTVPNESGLLIGGGTKYNMIGGDNSQDRNIFSGNRFAGIQIADMGTQSNLIKGNFIGTDISGLNAKPNYYGMCLISNAKNNTIDNNTISGNKGFGLLFENADSNFVVSNRIGVASDNTSPLGNGAAGIVMYAGSVNNRIGLPGQGNIIAHHDTAGILVMDNTTLCNTFSSNSIYGNNYLGIEIMPPGVNLNDATDADNGPNDMMNFPVITTAVFNPVNNYIWVQGTLDTDNPEQCTVELFTAHPNVFSYGDGEIFFGTVHPDTSGHWNYFGPGPLSGSPITATATNACGSTSEFTQNFTVVLDIPETETAEHSLNVYPNPATNLLTIESPVSNATLNIINLLGQEIISKDITERKIELDVSQLNRGIYLVKLYNNNITLVKIIVVE